jgi:hypothetical protein
MATAVNPTEMTVAKVQNKCKRNIRLEKALEIRYKFEDSSEFKICVLRIESTHDHNSMRQIKFSSKPPLCTY